MGGTRLGASMGPPGGGQPSPFFDQVHPSATTVSMPPLNTTTTVGSNSVTILDAILAAPPRWSTAGNHEGAGSPWPAVGGGCDSSSCTACHWHRSRSVASLVDSPSAIQAAAHHLHDYQKGALHSAVHPLVQHQHGEPWLDDAPGMSKSLSAPDVSCLASSTHVSPATSQQVWLETTAAVQPNAFTPVQLEQQRSSTRVPTTTAACLALVQQKQKHEGINHSITSSSECNCSFEPGCSNHSNGSIGMLPWRFEPRWASLPDPVPAAFADVATFSTGQANSRQRNIICGVDFADTGRFFATASITKQLCVYSLLGNASSSGVPSRPVAMHSMPSKLSAIAWVPYSEGLVTVGDYDGVVCQVDVTSGHYVSEVDEHDGRRVLSVAHSRSVRGLCASASEDGTCRLWGSGPGREPAALLRPGAAGTAVCCADFCPDGGGSNLLALACADGRAYVYDLRHLAAPLLATAGHARAASYARFLGPNRLVSAGVDGRLALWDLHGASAVAVAAGADSSDSSAAAFPCLSPAGGPVAAAAAASHQGHHKVMGVPSRTFHGHCNERNFVGLAVHSAEELVATGSECSRVFTYRTSWGSPMASHCLETGSVPTSACSPTAAALHDEFVSAVAWQPQQQGAGAAPLLVAATSKGRIKALQLRLTGLPPAA